MHPTLLRTPGQRRHGFPHERILPCAPGDCAITEMPRGFFTVRDKQGARLYFGPGPVEVVRSPAPF